MIASETVGYDVFLPTISASLRSKKKKDANLSDDEFKSVVAIAFKDAMIQFCKESELYTQDIPIDFYDGVRVYSIIPPDGFQVVGIKRLLDGVYKAKNIGYTLEHIELPKRFCPKEYTPNAIYVRVALKPTHMNNECKFQKKFVDRYFEEIRDLMFHYLYLQDQRVWADLGRSDRYLRSYRKKMMNAKRNNLGFQGGIRRIGYSITDARHAYNR